MCVAALFVACGEKDLYEGERTDKTVNELNVPSGFDWNMISNVSCDFTAATATPIAVYTDASCNDNSLMAEYTLEPDMDALTLSIPTYVTALYIKMDGGAATKVPVVDGVATFEAPSTRAETILPGDYDDESDEKFAWVYFPSKAGMATVMFEDYFPTKGDYDFNDFVANYSYAAKLSKKQGNGKDPSKFHVVSIDFKVKVKALGGLYDYTPYLRVLGMKVGNKDGFEGEGVTLIDDANGAPIVRIDDYTRKPAGVQYLNTDPEETIVPYADLKTVTFTINANNENGTGVKQDDLQFDFYLEGTGHLGGNYEIHQRDFAPVSTSKYPTGASGLGSTYYTTTDNLVWGITVPADIKHATEKTNFLKAYPAFGGWAESEGRSNLDWYTKNVDENYLFTIPQN